MRFPNRASNPADPSLCCNAVRKPSAWTARFTDGGTFDPPGSSKPVAGDFNGDGFSDLAVADFPAQRVLIYLNQMGTLVRTDASYTLSAMPYDLVVLDLNRDGVADIATVNGDATLSVLIGRGDGTFEAPRGYPSCAPQDGSLKAGDFNGDGVPDLICACGLFFAGIGDGGLLPGAPIPISANGPAAAGDFNGDGKLDIAVDQLFGGILFVAIGDGDGHFSSVRQYAPTEPAAFDLTSGDFDGDGLTDIAVHAALSGCSVNAWKDQGVSVLRGIGGGAFGPPTWIPIGVGTPGRLSTADLAGDGRRELLVSTPFSLAQLMFVGGGAQIRTVVAPSDAGLWWPTGGDFNGDHAQDIAAGGNLFINGCP